MQTMSKHNYMLKRRAKTTRMKWHKTLDMRNKVINNCKRIAFANNIKESDIILKGFLRYILTVSLLFYAEKINIACCKSLKTIMVCFL